MVGAEGGWNRDGGSMSGRRALAVAGALVLLAAVAAAARPGFLAAQEEQIFINKYGWFDEVVFLPEADRAKAVEMLKKGDIDIYFIDIGDPELYREIRESPELTYEFSYGLYYELTFNPYGPEFTDGRLNPFNNSRIREAMNYIVDRDYIADEIMGGLAVPKFTCLVKALPEAQRFIDEIEEIEEEYAYDFEKGKQIITEEMEKMGATLVDGKWMYKGEPVVIKFIIRIEDARKEIGDYVASQLEKLGFTVERMYKTSKEASPLWILGDPKEGKWHMYTGGWITTAVSRDDSDNFQFFYTQDSPLSWSPLWASYTPDPRFREVARRLAEKDFRSIEERSKLMREALKLAMKDSVRVWLVDQIAVWARRKSLFALADYAGGYPTALWSSTMKFVDKVGGTVKIASSEVIVDPWNPVAPSDWIYDTMIYDYGVWEHATVLHPKTGLPIPVNIRKASVWVEMGLPTSRNPGSEYWLDFKYVSSVVVPTDAWYAWDVENKRMITAGEAGVTSAKARVVVDYGDILGKPMFHDGTELTLADFLINFIVPFERASEASPLYDESYVGTFQTFRQLFTAFRILSERPLVIEYFVNYIHIDAELIADYAANVLWPTMPWHTVAIGIMAEADKKLAFSADKADMLKVDWMNYIGGPSLEVLSSYLRKAYAEAYIPFKEFLGDYVTPGEALKRYEKLKEFYEARKHFWVGNGPFYLDRVDITAHTATLKSIRHLPYKIEKVCRDISQFSALIETGDYNLVAFGYDKEIASRLLPGKEAKEELDILNLVLGGPIANPHAAKPLEEAGIKFEGNVMKIGGKEYVSTWGKIDYGVVLLSGNNLYVAGITRYGTEAALQYILGKAGIMESLIVVKWEDTNGNGKVDSEEISLVG